MLTVMATAILAITKTSGKKATPVFTLCCLLFRCMPPARCVPVVVNGNTAVQLPKQGESFAASDIIGRCVTPCACNDEPISSQVCGSDGRTYASTCYANCANIEVCMYVYGVLYMHVCDTVYVCMPLSIPWEIRYEIQLGNFSITLNTIITFNYRKWLFPLVAKTLPNFIFTRYIVVA